MLLQVDFDIHVQMLEIYNEMLRDLLISDSKKANKLDIRSTEKSGLNVPDAVQVQVECTEDVLDVMEKGSMNRACSGTKMNDRSSRSHSVLTVIVDGTSRYVDPPKLCAILPDGYCFLLSYLFLFCRC